MTAKRRSLTGAALLGALLLAGAAEARVKVVTTLTDYAWAAEAVGGDLVEVSSICPAEQDPHFLAPRPSYALRVAEADLFVDTGLDLELWASTLLQKAGNARVMPGQPGYVSAAQGVVLRDKPASADRSQGDVHIFGNPHLHTSPLNMRAVLRNVGAGLARVDPDRRARYQRGVAQAVRALDVKMFGAELVDALGGDSLARLAHKGKLLDFLRQQELGGRPLIERLGGWYGALAPYRGSPIVTYHPNWTYLSADFGLPVAATIEVKPGVAPAPRHVSSVLRTVRDQGVPLIFAASHYSREQVESVAKRAGVPAGVVPFHSGGAGAKTYPALVDAWVRSLRAALAQKR